MKRALAALVLVAGLGCGNETDRLRLDVANARILLAKPAPQDPEWAARRTRWLADADADAPEGAK